MARYGIYVNSDFKINLSGKEDKQTGTTGTTCYMCGSECVHAQPLNL